MPEVEETGSNGPRPEITSNRGKAKRGRVHTRGYRGRGAQPVHSNPRERVDSSRDSGSLPEATTTSPQRSSSPVIQRNPNVKAKRDIPCRYWRSGACAKGDKCWYKHDPAVLEEIGERTMALTRQDAERKEREASVRLQRITLGSLVTFSAGMEIARVIPGFEVARIFVKNLPLDVTPNEVKEIFTQQVIHSDDIFVEKVFPVGNTKRAIVYAKSDDAGNIAVGLEGIEFRDKTLQFDVREVVSSEGMGSSAPGTPVLHISWYLPSTTYSVSYSSREVALENFQRLNQASFNGQKVTAKMQGRLQIRVFGLSPDMDNDDIVSLVNSHAVTLLPTYDVPESIRALEVFLENQPIDRRRNEFHVVSENNRGKVVVKAIFSTWAQAKQVRDLLISRKRLVHGGPAYHVVLPKEHQYSISILPEQYEAQKSRWAELKSRGNIASSLQILEAKNGHDKVLIRVLGDDKKAVGALKVRVENLAAGEKLGPEYWNRSFATPSGRTYLKSVLDQTSVFVLSDWKQRTLKLYGGSPVALENARIMIAAEVERLKSMEVTIDLTSRVTVQFLMRKGMDMLKDLIGEENISLHLDTRPRKLVVRGGQDAIDNAQRVIQQSFETFAPVHAGNAGDHDTCPVCFDEVQLPEQLVCGHAYCTSCLRHYVTSDADRYPLVCVGSDATCGRPIPLPVFQRFMPNSTNVGQLFDKVFKLYIEQHPDELKYCATPDCGQVYRRDSENAVELQCPSCLATVCSKCDATESHAGMTCEEYRINSNPLEQERLNSEWAEANGIKKCPRCQVLVEKIAGCNHISCKCGAHFCWICNGIFESETIYDHMSREHGGFYAEARPNANVNQIAAPAPPPAPAPLPAEYQRPEVLQEQEREWNRIQRDRLLGAVPARVPVHRPPVNQLLGARRVEAEGGNLQNPAAQGVPRADPVLVPFGVALRRERERRLALERAQIEAQNRATAERIQHFIQAQQPIVQPTLPQENSDRGWCVIM